MLTLSYVKERVRAVFYYHGLFCASHPITILIFVISLFLFLCHPLLNKRLPGSAPQEHVTPIENYTVPKSAEDHLGPRWFQGEPLGFIQQVVVHSAVSPWDRRTLVQTDAYRASISTVFEILDKMNNFVYQNGKEKISWSDRCLRVSELGHEAPRDNLPEYGCLILSPANLWKLDKTRFEADGQLMSTIYKKSGQNLDTPPTLRDLLFGVPWIETGISRLSIRNRQRVITYAITIVLKKYDRKFMEALKTRLEQNFPTGGANNMTNKHIVHIHFLNFRNLSELLEHFPLLVTYILLLFYLYFSVRKIEMVKSKWGLALSAVAMVLASLLSSVAICAYFGITPSLNSGEIFPYLVLFIGFENVLVLTKSVVATPVDLEVKVRIAQGLSQEGWSITKNLIAEMIILFCGFFTFVPDIQEFCLFAVVGLLTDFFLQMVFFVTVLSIDIRRMELSDLHKKSIQRGLRLSQPTTFPPMDHTGLSQSPQSRHQSMSGEVVCPVLNQLYNPRSPGIDSPKVSDVFFGDEGPEPTYYDPNIMKLPRRIRLLYFWANTRVVQRFIMVCTVIWIGLILHKVGLVEHLVQKYIFGTTKKLASQSIVSDSEDSDIKGLKQRPPDLTMLYTGHTEHWHKLSYNHWPVLLSYYNLSLSDRYLSLLPSIHLSLLISPDEVITKRHPFEQVPTEQVKREIKKPSFQSPKLTLYPESGSEVFITILLGVMSALLMLYFVMLLYRCICSKNYARWRSSWFKNAKRPRPSYIHIIRDSLPLVMKGHLQEIETIVSDGGMVVSSCLGGQVRTWDISNTTCIKALPRHLCMIPPMIRKPCLGRNILDSDHELYAEYHEKGEGMDMSHHEPRVMSQITHRKTYSTIQLSKQSTLQDSANTKTISFSSQPDLSETIETDFSEINQKAIPQANNQTKYDFKSHFDQHYKEHRQYLRDSEKHSKMVEQRILETEELGGAGDYVEVNETRISHLSRTRTQSSSSDESVGRGDKVKRYRSVSEGSDSLEDKCETNTSVWCLACQDNLVLAGCANGRIEIWNGMTGDLKCLYEEVKIGVTGLCFVGKRIIAARFDGTLDFLEIETFTRPVKYTLSGSEGHAAPPINYRTWSEDVIRCVRAVQTRAHQQPITCLQCEAGRVVTASQDHTLKVYRLEDSLCLFTLHGHLESVTALFLDKITPMVALSGSEGGDVRVWDLLNGSCVHQLTCHTGPITSLVSTPYHYVSCSMDDRLCVWERQRGHCVHCIQLDAGYCNSMSALSSAMLITGGQGCLMMWDLNKGVRLRTIRLGDHDHAVFVRQVITLNDSTVVCDYGNELRVVHFPLVLDKLE